jgi:transposase
MARYGGIDLHANNRVMALRDAHDQVVTDKRLPNHLNTLLAYLAPYHAELVGLVVESTYHWYWRGDGLREAGYRVHLAHTAAIKQYEGLKLSNDQVEARWVAHLLRLGLLPEGYLSPTDERAVRDLWRKRAQLVRQQVTQMLSIQALFARHTGHALGANRIRQRCAHDRARQVAEVHVALAVTSNLRILRCWESHIQGLERVVLRHMRSKPERHGLKTGPGSGDILAFTILLEAGPVARFPSAGDFASSCRCVKRQRLSTGTVQGQGNTKDGNKYLGWAFVEAAHCAMRFDPGINRFYQRKQVKRHQLVALKPVTHTWARACDDSMRDQVPFERAQAFGL